MSTEALQDPAAQAPSEIVAEATVVLQRTSDPSHAPFVLGEKTTVGSGRSCTLQLCDEGVKPLHCLITSSSSGWTVRRWSDGTLLNGESFSESALQFGDRISIGPVEFEFSQKTPSQTAANAPPEAAEAPHERPEGKWASQNMAPIPAPAIEPASQVNSGPLSVVQDSSGSTAHARRRARSLVKVLRSRQRELQLHQTQVVELEARITLVELERDQLNKERELLLDKLETLANQLAGSQLELSTERDSRQCQEQEFAEQLQDLEAELAARNELVLDLRAEIERQPMDSRGTGCETPEPTEAASPASNKIIEDEGSAQSLEPSQDGSIATSPTSTETAKSFQEPAEAEENQSLDPEALKDTAIGEFAPDSTVTAKSVVPLAPRVKVAPEQMWDVETQAAKDNQDELSQFEAPEQLSDRYDTEQRADRQESSSAARQETDSDLLGRLNSLRAAASEKLHHEVEGYKVVAPADNSPPQPKEEHSAAIPIFELADKISEPTERAQPEDSLPEFATAVDPPTEMADMHSEELGDVVPTGTTTLFDVPPSAPAETEREEPISYVEKFKHLLEEDGESAVDSHPAPQPVAEPARSHEPATDLSEDDESIEDYMAKMMSRLRGTPEPVAAEPAVSEKTTPVKTTPVKVEAEKPVSAEPVVKEPLLTSLESLKTQSRPEHNTDMTALRNLANNSAREAIKLSQSRKRRDVTVANLMFSLIAGSAGGFMVWASKGALGLPLFGGAAAVIASGYWGAISLRSLLTRSDLRPRPAASGAELSATDPDSQDGSNS